MASLRAQQVENPPAVQEMQVWSLGQEAPLEKGVHPAPVILPGKSPGQRSLVGYSPWESQKVTHDWSIGAQHVQRVDKGLESSFSKQCGLLSLILLKAYPEHWKWICWTRYVKWWQMVECLKTQQTGTHAWSGKLQGIIRGCNTITAMWLADWWIICRTDWKCETLSEKEWEVTKTWKKEKQKFEKSKTKGKATPSALILKEPCRVVRGTNWDTACQMP